MNQQYILTPKSGIRAKESQVGAVLFHSLPTARSTQGPQFARIHLDQPREFRVLDSIEEERIHLVELDDETLAYANHSASPFRALPLVDFDAPNRPISLQANTASNTTVLTLTVQDAQTRIGVEGAKILAFDNFRSQSGSVAFTDSAGIASLTMSTPLIDRLYVYPPPNYWGAFRQTLQAKNLTIPIEPVDLTFTDSLRHYFPTSQFNPEAGVKIGIIDSGIGPHKDLNITGGHNTVTGEPDADWMDPNGHGTHVAGIVGSNGVPPYGLRGVAPNAQIFALRVFGQNASSATNYSILKALIFAANARCDIVNLSLGGGPYDNIVEEAINDAREQGILVICATGNDGRGPVNYPAAYENSNAVSAMGRIGTFTAGSLGQAEIVHPPHGNDPMEFIAGFSNVGSQVSCVGPGVDVLSTLPNDQFGPMSGTSMAAPVVTGAAGSLLSRNSEIFDMPRDRARSDAIKNLLRSSFISHGFGMIYEGNGMPDPNVI